MRNKGFAVFEKADADANVVPARLGIFVFEREIAQAHIALIYGGGFLPLIPCAAADAINHLALSMTKLDIAPAHKA